jgi:hypothetical protein
MCCVLLETNISCMCGTMCLKPIYVCVELIIYATSCICYQCITYLIVGQLLVDEFFCLVSIVVVIISNICPANKNVKKKNPSIQDVFFIPSTPGLPIYW